VRRRLRDVGEHAWLATLPRRLRRASPEAGIVIGPGDDAAVVRVRAGRLLLTTDALIEGVHFRTGWLSPRALGRRAFSVNASDVAAMGGRPRWALLAAAIPPATPVRELDAVLAGFAAAARRDGAQVVGGNIAAGRHLALTAALVGEARGRVVTRAGARAGDGLWVTGTLGACGLAVRRLAAGHAGQLPDAPSRVRAGERLAAVASAMIDVSDGLAQDLGHLCRASGVGAVVDLSCLPVAPACRRALGPAAARFALTAGEDYELLFAVPRVREAALARLAPRLGCRITRIGRMTKGSPWISLVAGTQPRRPPPRGGFDHFR
jgi:thiamine-monophosphate kinase